MRIRGIETISYSANSAQSISCQIEWKLIFDKHICLFATGLRKPWNCIKLLSSASITFIFF